MKNHLFSVWLLFLFTQVLFPKPEITSNLSKEIKHSLENDSFIESIIIMKNQVDVISLDKELYQIKAGPSERSKTIIEALQKKANTTQKRLVRYLRSQPKDMIKNIRPYWIINMIVLEAKPQIILQLLESEDIAQIDLDRKLVLDAAQKLSASFTKTPGAAEPGLKVINAHKLWQLGYTGAGRIVMNIDTGVDGNHPALGWRWRGNHVPDSLAWFDPVYGTTFPNDPNDHGTATMGISCGLDSITNDTIGVAFGAEWIASNSLYGNPHTSYTIAAFQWAMDPDGNPSTIDDMPDAINCSWWDPAVGFCDTTYAMVFNAVEAAGIAIVFSAGGGGPSYASIFQPANINTNEVNTWVTGAVDGSIPGYPIKSSSGRGPSQCYTGIFSLDIKPEGCAPGVNIRTSVNNNGYYIYSGSSMATAHVTGAVALLKQAFPYLTGHEIKMALYNSALDLGDPGEDNVYGMGLIDVWAAYSYLSNYANPFIAFSTHSVADTILSGSSSYKTFIIYNSQSDTSYLNFNISENPQFDWLQVTPPSGTVAASDSIQIRVDFDASNLSPGNHFTQLFISSNDSANTLDSINVLLTVVSNQLLTCSDSLLIGNVPANEIDSTSFWLYNNFFTTTSFHLFLDGANKDKTGFNHIDSLQWNVQFSYNISPGNTGVEFDGTYYYVTRAFSNLIHKYDIAGNFIEQFSIPGVTGLRDLAFDGTHMFGGSASNTIYIMDFVNQTLVGTIISPSAAVRHIAYDEGFDAFWIGNWDTDIELIHRNGTLLNTIPAYTSGLRIYGSAYDGYSPGGPFLWVFDQGTGPGSPKYIRQIDLATGFLTGVMHDVTTDFPTATGLAGGLFVSNNCVPNAVTLGGILNDTAADILFGYEISSYQQNWVHFTPKQGTLFAFDSTKIKVYWNAQDTAMTNQGFIGTYTNDPVNPVQHLVQVILNTIVNSIEENEIHLPEEHALYQNYPNPFNPSTRISYSLKSNAIVSITIFNTLGEKIRTLVNKKQSSGHKNVLWDGLNDYGEQVASGIYIYKLEISDQFASQFIQSRKMVFMK